MQIGDWGNVLIRNVCERKHRKYPLWACPFSGVEFCGAFHFQKKIILQLLQIWSSYCVHCNTDQLWMHTQSNNKTKCFKRILLTVKNRPPFAHLLALKIIYMGSSSVLVLIGSHSLCNSFVVNQFTLLLTRLPYCLCWKLLHTRRKYSDISNLFAKLQHAKAPES